MIELIKYSLPNDWTKSFDTMDEVATELRKHICGQCLHGDLPGEWPVDVVHDGQIFECRDVGALLSTPCGCEYGIEGDEADAYWEARA